jgi:hypothetical protein
MRAARVLVLVAAFWTSMAREANGADAVVPIGCYGGDYGQTDGAFSLFFDGVDWYLRVGALDYRPVAVGQDTFDAVWMTWVDYQAATGAEAGPPYPVECESGVYPLQGLWLMIEADAWYVLIDRPTFGREGERGICWAPFGRVFNGIDYTIDGQTVVRGPGGILPVFWEVVFGEDFRPPFTPFGDGDGFCDLPL